MSMPTGGSDGDLEYSIELTQEQALCGLERSFSWVDGRDRKTIQMRIPAGVVDGTTLRCAGLGRPRRDGSLGDLYIRLHVGAGGIASPKPEPVVPGPSRWAQAVLGAMLLLGVFALLWFAFR